MQHVRMVKDMDGHVLTSEGSVLRRWRQYFKELLNEENERERRVDKVETVEQEVRNISRDEVKALKMIKLES